MISGSFAWITYDRSKSGCPSFTGRVPFGDCGGCGRPEGISSNRNGIPLPNLATTRVLGAAGWFGTTGASPTRINEPR